MRFVRLERYNDWVHVVLVEHVSDEKHSQAHSTSEGDQPEYSAGRFIVKWLSIYAPVKLMEFFLPFDNMVVWLSDIFETMKTRVTAVIKGNAVFWWLPSFILIDETTATFGFMIDLTFCVPGVGDHDERYGDGLGPYCCHVRTANDKYRNYEA